MCSRSVCNDSGWFSTSSTVAKASGCFLAARFLPLGGAGDEEGSPVSSKLSCSSGSDGGGVELMDKSS